MAPMHRVSFPRYAEDITSERRTLFHLLNCNFVVGEGLILVTREKFGRATCASITKIDRMPLCPLPDDDLRLLNRDDREAYLASWDAQNPGSPAASNPLIYRIEFAYDRDSKRLDPPEWSLAA